MHKITHYYHHRPQRPHSPRASSTPPDRAGVSGRTRTCQWSGTLGPRTGICPQGSSSSACRSSGSYRAWRRRTWCSQRRGLWNSPEPGGKRGGCGVRLYLEYLIKVLTSVLVFLRENGRGLLRYKHLLTPLSLSSWYNPCFTLRREHSRLDSL